tara:strand:- start:340 stop:1074 length:735 start_codon:yes stop_codon:yes gene_type:complete
MVGSGGTAFADIRLFAAASTTGPLTEIITKFRDQTGNTAVPVFAASGSLARQIAHGAPADLFLAAHPRWMNWLSSQNLLRVDRRGDVAGNCLVLVQPKNATPLPSLASAFVEALAENRIAIGDPNFVPAGEYAVSVLKHLGIWTEIATHAARLPSARHVLFMVQRGEVAAGLIYHSDAKDAANIKIAEVIPSKLHDDIVYPLAIIKESGSPVAAEEFFDFLLTAPSRAIFERYGFRSIDERCPD